MKNRPVGVELYHADRRTDMKKLTVAFRTSAKKGLIKTTVYQKTVLNVCIMFVTLSSYSTFRCFCFRRNIPVTNRKVLRIPYTKYVQN